MPFLVLGLTAAATTWLLPGSVARLAWTRTAIAGGELWRLLTAHFVHATTAHLVVDLAALALVALLVGGELTASDWWLVALAGALGSGLAVLWLSPATLAFAGLSAVVHGLLAAGCTAACLRRSPLGFALAAGLALKLALERWGGAVPALALAPAAGIAHAAHLYASLAGAAAAFLLARRRRNVLAASRASAARDPGPNLASSSAISVSGPAKEGSEE
jgi:rhomboid family GlyGly-CTERM serine protease